MSSIRKRDPRSRRDVDGHLPRDEEALPLIDDGAAVEIVDFDPPHAESSDGLQLVVSGVLVVGASLRFLEFCATVPRERLDLALGALVDELQRRRGLHVER